MIGATIARTHGNFRIFSDQAGANEQAFGAIGIGVFDGEAVDAGIVSLPTPYTESDDGDWFFHAYWACDFSISGVGSSANPFNVAIDNKAMRKLGDNDVICWIIQNQSTSAGATFVWATRQYILLP